MRQVSKQAAKHKSLLDYKDLGKAFRSRWSPAGGAGFWGEDSPQPPMHTPLQTLKVRHTLCASKWVCFFAKLANLYGGGPRAPRMVPQGRYGGVPAATSQLMDWQSGTQTEILRPP